jgi:hypothetical protein
MMKVAKRSTVHLPHFMRSRWFIIGAFASIIALAAAYGWWSNITWNSYENQYVSLQKRIDAQLTATFSLQSDTSDEKQVKLAELSKLQAELGSNNSLCSQNKLIDWQQRVIKEYAKRDERCREVQSLVASFEVQLRAVVEYLQNEHTLADILAAGPSQAEVNESEFEGQLQAWHSIAESIKNTRSAGSFGTVKQSAMDTMGNVVKAWEEVITAHQAKDKVRYTKATQELAASYDRLGNIAAASTIELTKIAANLKEAYQNLK